MNEQTPSADPLGFPNLRRASELSAPMRRGGGDLIQRRKERFRLQFSRELDRSGLSLAELAAKASVDEAVLRRWLRLGVAQPGHDHLQRVAKAFGLEDPRSFFEDEDGELDAVRRIDRQTNPMVDEVRSDRPILFDQFSADDWDELYSCHGTGGPLTYDGVITVAEKINRKRELRQKFEAVLETHHFDTLASLIELMYQQTQLS